MPGAEEPNDEYKHPKYTPENLNGHCWHYAGLDEFENEMFICCRCGTAAKSVASMGRQIPQGHGPYHPAAKDIVTGYVFTPEVTNCPKGPSQ